MYRYIYLIPVIVLDWYKFWGDGVPNCIPLKSLTLYVILPAGSRLGHGLLM